MTFVDLVLRWVRKNLMLLYAIAIPVVIQTTQITKAITTISMLNEELFLYRPIWSLNGLYSILSRYDHPQSLGIHNIARSNYLYFNSDYLKKGVSIVFWQTVVGKLKMAEYFYVPFDILCIPCYHCWAIVENKNKASLTSEQHFCWRGDNWDWSCECNTYFKVIPNEHWFL